MKKMVFTISKVGRSVEMVEREIGVFPCSASYIKLFFIMMRLQKLKMKCLRCLAKVTEI